MFAEISTEPERVCVCVCVEVMFTPKNEVMFALKNEVKCLQWRPLKLPTCHFAISRIIVNPSITRSRQRRTDSGKMCKMDLTDYEYEAI